MQYLTFRWINSYFLFIFELVMQSVSVDVGEEAVIEPTCLFVASNVAKLVISLLLMLNCIACS